MACTPNLHYVAISFFLNDTVDTIMTEANIAQASVVSFLVTANPYFGIVQGVSWSIFPCLGVVLQVKFALSTKTVLYAFSVGCCLHAAWVLLDFVALLIRFSALLLVSVDEAGGGAADCERFLGVKAEEAAQVS